MTFRIIDIGMEFLTDQKRFANGVRFHMYVPPRIKANNDDTFYDAPWMTIVKIHAFIFDILEA